MRVMGWVVLWLLACKLALAQVVATRDVRYAFTPGVAADLQSLDVYAPGAAQRAPVVVGIHGGGWSTGDKANAGFVQNKASYFAARGYVFVSINYRLSPQFVHPAHVDDVAAALAWTRAHVAEFGGDPERIFVLGHSAGAHLAALATVDDARLGQNGQALAAIKGAILLDTAKYDLDAVYPGGSEVDGNVLQAFGNEPAVLRDGSPIDHVAPGKHIAPMAVFHLAQREDASASSVAFVGALNVAGVAAMRHAMSGYTHGSINENFGTAGDATTALAQAFLDARLAELAAQGLGPGGFDVSYAGSYWDAARSGEGVMVDVAEVSGTPTLFVAWYTYDTQGNPLYLVGATAYAPANQRATLAMVRTFGARFGSGFDANAVIRQAWGEVDLEVLGCDSLRLNWRASEAGYGSGTRVLTRFLPRAAGLTCP
jgi:acetyl esterase/lipase